MKRTRFTVLLSALVLTTVAAKADGIMYLDDAYGDIYAGDPDAATPVYSSIGNIYSSAPTQLVAGGLTDIGFAAGTLYGLDSGGNLYSVNTSNAALTFIGNTGVTDGSLVGLSDSTSALLLAGGSGQTYSLDLGTGAATSLGVGGNGYTTAGDLDFDGSGNLWLTSTTPSGTGDALWQINPDGTGTDAGFLPYLNVWGMAYDGSSGTLWGYTNGGTQFDVNTANPSASGGSATFTLTAGDDSYVNLLGAAYIAPEPSSLVLMGSGLILFVLYRRRKAHSAV